MRRSVAAFVAICALPGFGAAQPALTPEQIVEFFTRDDSPAADQGEVGRTRGISAGDPARGADRGVHIGPTGFGSSSGVGDTTGQPAGPDPGALDLLITFEHDSTRLSEAAQANLEAFVQALEHPALAGLRFAVDGHTDATGPEDYNQRLSEDRAAAVVDYLTGHGIDAARLEPRGFGESRPRTDDPMHPQNRRVETRRLP